MNKEDCNLYDEEYSSCWIKGYGSEVIECDGKDNCILHIRLGI